MTNTAMTRTLALSIISALSATTAFAKPPAAEAVAAEQVKPLIPRVLDAYRNVSKYSATVTFSISQKQGRWTNIQQSEYRIAIDRKARRIKIDHPYIFVVSDGKNLLLKSNEFRGAHVQVEAPTPLDYEGVLSELILRENDQDPGQLLLNEPPPVDMAFMLSTNPLNALAGDGADGNAKDAGVFKDDNKKRERFAVKDHEGHSWIFYVDARSGLINRAVKRFDAEAMGGGPGDEMHYVLEMKIENVNGEFSKDAFAFDTTNSKATRSLQEMIQAAAAVGGPDGAGPHPLIGQNAPDIALKKLDGKDFKLSEEKSAVIILDFWATWCPPCRDGLPKLQEIADWAKKEKHSVAIYPINLQEDKQTITRFWTDQKFTMPVLMDSKLTAARAYQVEPIPQTVVISGGRIRDVMIGLLPNMKERLKGHIKRFTAKDEKAEEK